MNIKIRKAASSDLDALCMLYHAFYEYNASQQPGYYQACDEKGVYPLSVIEGQTGEIFIASDNSNIIGFLHVEISETPAFPPVVPHRYGEIIDFYLCEPYRRKGIGKMLLSEAKVWKMENGLDYLELMVLSNNADAIRFYQNEGLKTVSHIMRFTEEI